MKTRNTTRNTAHITAQFTIRRSHSLAPRLHAPKVELRVDQRVSRISARTTSASPASIRLKPR